MLRRLDPNTINTEALRRISVAAAARRLAAARVRTGAWAQQSHSSRGKAAAAEDQLAATRKDSSGSRGSNRSSRAATAWHDQQLLQQQQALPGSFKVGLSQIELDLSFMSIKKCSN